LKAVVPGEVVASLQDGFFLSDFGVRNVEIVGPQVGAQLRRQAVLAVLYSLLGMLVYLWFRFELIYGVAAVVTVFHDTLITVGAFSLANKEVSLTVIAAILTLVGYSNNDTIVVFDRIRENLKLLRREKLSDIVNKSINQTLSRTILTAGLTFLTVLALYPGGLPGMEAGARQASAGRGSRELSRSGESKGKSLDPSCSRAIWCQSS
jgi:preprotein translocase subunit SecF